MTLTQTDINNIVLCGKESVGKKAANLAKKSDYGEDIDCCINTIIIMNMYINILCGYTIGQINSLTIDDINTCYEKLKVLIFKP